MVMRRGERSGSIFLVAKVEEFKDVMDKMSVINLPLLSGE